MAVSKRLRYEVFRRDNHTCRYCGGKAPDVELTIDHVTPVTLGGQDVPENLVTACVDCNAGKSATPPDAALVADVDEKAVRWRGAMEVVLSQRAAELSADRKRIGKFDRKWRSFRTYGEHYPRDANWRNSVTRFLAAGLDDQFLADAVETAVGRPRMPADDVWRYFCGICWRELDDLQKRALAVVAPAPAEDLDPDSDEAMLAEGFPFMEMANIFLDGVLRAADIHESARLIFRRSLWDVLAKTDATWRTNMFGGDPDDHAEFMEGWNASDDVWHTSPPSRYELACDFLVTEMAWDMNQARMAIGNATGDTCPSTS